MVNGCACELEDMVILLGNLPYYVSESIRFFSVLRSLSAAMALPGDNNRVPVYRVRMLLLKHSHENYIHQRSLSKYPFLQSIST